MAGDLQHVVREGYDRAFGLDSVEPSSSGSTETAPVHLSEDAFHYGLAPTHQPTVAGGGVGDTRSVELLSALHRSRRAPAAVKRLAAPRTDAGRALWLGCQLTRGGAPWVRVKCQQQVEPGHTRASS